MDRDADKGFSGECLEALKNVVSGEGEARAA